MLLGQLPPTLVVEEVARSLESSDGKNGTLCLFIENQYISRGTELERN
jgi:hypothetical protein